MADRWHIVHLLSRYLEGELPPTERETVERHLRTCTVCLQELVLLRQTVDALQGLPLETTPADFVEKLNQRIEQEARLRHLEEQRERSHTLALERHEAQEAPLLPAVPAEPSRAVLVRWVRSWWRSVCFPLSIKIPIYGTVVLGLATLLVRASPEKVKATLTPVPPAALTPPLSGPLSQRVASVASETIQPVGTAVPATEQLPAPGASLASSTDLPAVVEALAWPIPGSDPAVLREQVKAVAGRMSWVVIVKEEEHRLLISLPTPGLSVLRQELTTLGEVSAPEADPVHGTPTTLLQVTFIRRPAVSPPLPERLPSPS